MEPSTRQRDLFAGAASACLAAAFFILAIPNIAGAQAQSRIGDVVTVTTKRQVDIGLLYNGDHIYFFGNVPQPLGDVPDPDVVVKLTSMDNTPIVVNRKGKVGFIWMNVKQFEVSGLPLLYKIHSTRPIHQILSQKAAQELGIGYDVLKAGMKVKLLHGEPEPDDRDVVFDGILQLKQQSNLYNIDETRIEITGGALFKHYFRFPSAAKEGSYRAESYVIRDGQLIGKGVDEVIIRKTGIEAAFTKLSSERPAVYGCIAVVVALGMGLLMGAIFKKGGGH